MTILPLEKKKSVVNSLPSDPYRTKFLILRMMSLDLQTVYSAPLDLVMFSSDLVALQPSLLEDTLEVDCGTIGCLITVQGSLLVAFHHFTRNFW